MVLETPDHGISASAESKARKWRDKIFSKEKDASKAARDAQIDDFLGSSRRLPSQSQPRIPPRPGVPSPRIDVSISQRPRDANAPQSSTDAFFRPQNLQSPVKRRRRKGLTVKFCNDPPQIMGEGGDEADAPTKDMIAVYRTRSNSSASTFTDTSDFSPIDDHSPSDTHPSRHAIPPTIAIQSQSPVEDPTWRPPLIQNSHDSDFLLSLGEAARGSRLSLRQSSDPNSFARRVQAKMRADEGRAFQNRRDDRGESPTELASPLQTTAPQLGSDPPRSEEKSSTPSFWSSVLNALPDETKSTLRASPPSGPSISPSPTPTSNPPATYQPSRPPPYLKSPESSTASTQFQSYNEDKESSSLPKNLRNVATAVGDTALADFSDYVGNFGQLFSLAAESAKPSMETSLVEWVRACVWWFLKGRGELEAFMRSRPSSSGASSAQSDQSQQAVVNLAKAWWINQSIIPQHPELARFGRVSTDAMLSVAKNMGDLRVAHLITLHQNMIGHLRGLALSMKRHSMLPSGNDAPSLLQSVDTSIWIKYPFFAPDISAILSGSFSKSMLVDTSTKQADLGDVMPMGDSSRYFCYGRMFVDARISSGEDSSQEIAIPCMLSITRNRQDWNVIATITSQSELVNIAIQPDKNQGPTWADVDWQVRACSMRLRLPRGFELNVHFKQPDFNMLWKIVEYSRKVEASLQPEAGEKAIFEDILEIFQYVDPRPNKAFPPEPSPRCRIRLFKKAVKITEGTGTRQSHRGYRFVAVTSPKVKTLTSVSHHLGSGHPVVFGYLRGDNGAPALMLKAEDGDTMCSMILTFSDDEQRTKMHSLLLGIVPTDFEFQTSEIALKSFSIEQPVGSPGDLQIRLDVNMPTALAICRPPQNDLEIAVAENLVPKELPNELTSFLKTVNSESLIRKYNFATIQGLAAALLS
ncbi:conserved hypothetical protein [Uncinocarpus reesii 1704]|uniref:Uncharacterized protein n=1 Tax=Uncinocarpus reesii (strain UAMH 1704) TaxID=336963 RepID=C4JJ70_UNCRE|nr:uncharacterized protein UREG_01677 [Uncinocarpus reesii 1704]EEP76828.1 conserved hypothetical protein [Uncinocarpus reesii 1704]